MGCYKKLGRCLKGLSDNEAAYITFPSRSESEASFSRTDVQAK